MPKNNNIGIFSTGSLGDMLMTLPAIHLIQQLHPNEKFILIKDHQIEKQQFPIDDFFENLDFF
ncbi:MAG: hypothetical protein MJH11_07880, partial [Lentisphaeria bacterium]|nr:hypothetical protein [Lentisphaeria bacterium]